MGFCLGVYLEAVCLLLAIPNGAGQWELLADPVFLHRPQWPPPEPFSLSVVCVQPEVLELGVRLPREPVALENLIESIKVPPVEGHERPRPHHGLVPIEGLPGGARDGSGQRPKEPTETLYIPGLLQVLAHPRNLVWSEHRQREHLTFSLAALKPSLIGPLAELRAHVAFLKAAPTLFMPRLET